MPIVLKVAWRQVLRDRRRSWAVVIATALSTAALSSALALLVGMKQMFVGLAFDTVGHVTVEREGYRERAALLPVDLTVEDPASLVAGLRQHADVVAVTQELACGARLLGGERSADVLLRGIDVADTSWNRRYRQGLVGGGFPASSGGVVLGKGLAGYLGAAVGDTLTLLAYNRNGGANAVSVVVAGVFQTDRVDENEQLTIASLETVQRLLQAPASASAVLVRLRDADRTERVVAELTAPLAQRHLVAHPWREVYAEVAAGLVWVNLVIAVLFSIIVGVVVSGIANTQLIAVFEQMRVLGTLRSIGMSRRGVGALIVTQTALTGLLGSALGLAMGALIVRVAAVKGIDMGPQLDGIARVIYPVLSADVAAFCLLVGVTVSILAAAYPAYVAGRMRPVQALAFQ